jgi:signal transduction histidine kinase
MKSLLDCHVVFASGKRGDSAVRRSAALARAGARVRTCTLTEELWSSLAESNAELVIAWLDTANSAALASLDRLRVETRERGIATLLVSDDLALANERCVLWVPDEIADEAFVRSIADLLGPVRQLHHHQDLGRSLSAELRQADAHSQRLAQEIGELGHELRAMLNGILGVACNLRDGLHGALTHAQIEQARGIVTAVHRAAQLLDRTRSMQPSAAERGPLAPAPPRTQRSLLHLGQLAAEVCGLFSAVAERKGLALETDLDDSVCVWGEPLKLKQVITNLVVNAIKYTPQGGVTVRVAWTTPRAQDGVEARRSALITVSDTGPGIPAELHSEIWRRGFRASQHAQQVEGEGIGLHVVREIVLQHGGEIEVAAAEGGGAVFSVTLPQDRRLRARSGPIEKGAPT